MEEEKDLTVMEEEAEDLRRMAVENRIRNLIWTVSGDYEQKLKPDVERFRKQPDIVLYDTMLQGAFARDFDRDAYSMYLLKKIYCGAVEAGVLQAASLVTEAAVSQRLIRERPGVKDFRDRAYEEILDQEFPALSRQALGRLKLSWIQEKTGRGKSTGTRNQWIKRLEAISETRDTGDLIQLSDDLYNSLYDPFFEKNHGTLETVLSVSLEELSEYSWKDYLSEEASEDALETYLEKVSLEMTNFSNPGDTEQNEKEDHAKEAGKKVLVLDEKALEQMYRYVEQNYGKSYLPESEETRRNRELCRGIHSDCSLFYTEGILKNPVKNNYQLSYAKKQRDKNIHAYYEDHRLVKQNIRSLTSLLKKAWMRKEEVITVEDDHGILLPSHLWMAGRCEHGKLFRRELKSENLRLVVDILVDASGSQRVRQEKVALQAYVLAETMSNLSIPFRVMSFCTFWDYTILHRMRDYDDDRRENTHIFDYLSSSNNRDGLAIRAAGIDLLKREEEKKLLIVLSDGKPYDVAVNRPNARNPKPYRDWYAVSDTATEVRRLRQKGVQVLGVFTGEESELPAEQKIFGRDFAYTKDIRNFSRIAGNYLRKQIEE